MQNAIEIRGLTKHFNDFSLKNVSFSLPTGCIMGFIGANGAGKTTTIKLILDLLNRDGGEIKVLGQDLSVCAKEVKENIGVVLDESFFPENLTLGDTNRIMQRTYATWSSARFWEFAKRFELPEKKRFKEYSRGMKTKLSISVALSHDSRLLILDEATGGLDPLVRDEILNIFLEFIQDEHNSIFISSHIVSDLEKLCDYITFIHKGEIIFCEEKDGLHEKYGVLKCSNQEYERLDKGAVKGMRRSSFGVEALVEKNKISSNAVIDRAEIEDIMLFMGKERS